MRDRDHLQDERKTTNRYSDSIEKDERKKPGHKQFINKVSTVQNSIYGENGERYRIPINAAHLSALESFNERLFKTNDLPFEIYQHKKTECINTLKMAHDINMLPAYARIYSPSLSFPPDFDLFFRTYREHPIRHYSHVDWEAGELEFRNEGFFNEVGPEHAKMANDFVLTLREAAKRGRLRSRMSDWLSGPKRNRKYLRDFMIKLLEQHSRIMVVDLVFLYRKAACKNSKEAVERGLEQQQQAEGEYQSYMRGIDHHERPDGKKNRQVDLEELKNDLSHFFNNMRNKRKLFGRDKFIDYFGRIEYSRDAGYHVHICFFYKGSEVQRDIFYSHEIGKYWANITEGRGYYHSCNASAAQGKYKNIGIGMVEHDDFEKIRHLWAAVVYFVKASQVVRVKRTDKEQMVLHGKKKERLGERMGRPRGEGLSGPAYRAKLEKIFL